MMKKILRVFKNIDLSETLSQEESNKRLFIFAMLVGIFNLIGIIFPVYIHINWHIGSIFRLIDIDQQPITLNIILFAISFLTGAVYSFNRNKNMNAIICGISFMLLGFLASSIKIDLEGYHFFTDQKQYNFFVWFILPVFTLLPILITAIIANIDYSRKKIIMAVLGAILGCIILNNQFQILRNSTRFLLFLGFTFPYTLIFSFSINSEFLTSLYNCKGRINRIKFIVPYVILVYLTLFAIHSFMVKFQVAALLIDFAALLISCVLIISLFIAIIMISLKRLHDTAHNGKWLLLIFVPIANIYLLYLLFLKKGDLASNKYE